MVNRAVMLCCMVLAVGLGASLTSLVIYTRQPAYRIAYQPAVQETSYELTPEEQGRRDRIASLFPDSPRYVPPYIRQLQEQEQQIREEILGEVPVDRRQRAKDLLKKIDQIGADPDPVILDSKIRSLGLQIRIIKMKARQTPSDVADFVERSARFRRELEKLKGDLEADEGEKLFKELDAQTERLTKFVETDPIILQSQKRQKDLAKLQKEWDEFDKERKERGGDKDDFETRMDKLIEQVEAIK